ncbi:MAG: hypothetical protein JSW38_03940 [Dehalococcoidia bacterium]|nr:MAG: hypothetical protein JSW38_03940 [Dehalococcoidia bacterium]
MNTYVLYREIQHFRQVWLWLLTLGISGVTFYAMVQQLILGTPFGDNPASDTVLIIIVIVFGFMFPVFFYIVNLTTEVRGDGLYYRFFPFHLTFRKISGEDIRSCEARTYSPLREYGGCGIRWGAKGRAYNVGGNRGVQLELSNGSRILIGSQRSEELAEAIDMAIKRGANR